MLATALGALSVVFVLLAFLFGALYLLERRKCQALDRALGDADARWREVEARAGELMKFDAGGLKDKLHRLENENAALRQQSEAGEGLPAAGASASADVVAVNAELTSARRRIRELEARITDWEAAYRKLSANQG
jgi:predicted  nucleic acid-binding Zn-ribbon protein